MNKMTLQKEPAVIITAITSLATAIIGLLVAFNVPITEDQRNAILATLGALCTMILLLGPIIRGYVFSPNTVKDVAESAAQTGQVPPTVK